MILYTYMAIDLNYFGNTGIAEVRENVKLINKDVVLNNGIS